MADAESSLYMGAAFYTLTIIGTIMSLLATPGIIKPRNHMTMFMGMSLPTDEPSLAKLTLFWFMAQKSNFFLGIFLICSAFTCPCLPLVGFAGLLPVVRAGMGLRMMFGDVAQYMGVDTKAVMPLIILTGLLFVGSVVGIYMSVNDADYMAFAAAMEEAAPKKLDEYGALVYTLMGVAGFFTLSNLPPIFVPGVALGSYMLPQALPSDKYTMVKLEELMRLNAVTWTLLSFAQFAGIFMAPDLSVYGPMTIVFNLGFVALFMYNIINAADYGFQVPPAVFFMFLVSFSTGAAAMGLMLI